MKLNPGNPSRSGIRAGTPRRRCCLRADRRPRTSRCLAAAAAWSAERSRSRSTARPSRSCLVEGFFPYCSAADRPARRRASGFREIGLPFEADTAVTRHLAAFLLAHGSGGQPVQPTRILFNGGVFKSDALQAAPAGRGRVVVRRRLPQDARRHPGPGPSPLPGSGPLRLGQAEGRRADLAGARPAATMSGSRPRVRRSPARRGR